MPSPPGYYPYHHTPAVSGFPPAAVVPQAPAQSCYPSPDSSSSAGRHLVGTGVGDPCSAYFYAPPRASTSVHSLRERIGQDVSPHFTITTSARHPSLHFLLARDSATANLFTVDMRRDPPDVIDRDVYESYGGIWVMRSRPVHVRIVSREFHWVIDIKAAEAPDGERGVTCGDIWNRLHQALWEPLQDTDWAHLAALAVAHDRKAQQRIEYLRSVARQQIERGGDVVLRRLDWLMTKTTFVGLENDDGFRLSQGLLLPGRVRCNETWIAEFKERE